jgi:hypothetical protein
MGPMGMRISPARMAMPHGDAGSLQADRHQRQPNAPAPPGAG